MELMSFHQLFTKITDQIIIYLILLIKVYKNQ
jgi:hypothetical protein